MMIYESSYREYRFYYTFRPTHEHAHASLRKLLRDEPGYIAYLEAHPNGYFGNVWSVKAITVETAPPHATRLPALTASA